MTQVHPTESASNREAEVALELDDTQALRALTAEGSLPAFLILSADAQVIDAARKAAPSGMAITHAADIDEIADQLPTIEPGVLLVDIAGARDPAVLLPQLAQHFPDMVVIAAGKKEDSGSLFRLTAEGRVFRFLLKPLSHGQARLAIKAAAAQHIDLKASGARRAVQPSPAKPHNYIATYSLLAAALLIVIGGVWYTINRLTVEPTPTATVDRKVAETELPRAVPERVDPVVAELGLAEEAFAAGRYVEPRGDSALDLYRGALALDPDNATAKAGIRNVVEKILESAEAALTAERLEEATRNIETARDVDPTHSRLAFLDIQVARERERLRLTQERGVDHRVRTLLTQAEEDMRIGRLIEPASSNARKTLLSARRLDPTDPAVARAMRDLSVKLSDAARAALEAGNLKQAEAFVEAARNLGSAGAALATIERQLLQAQRAGRAPVARKQEAAVAKVNPPPAAPAPPAEPAPPPVANDVGLPIEALRIPRTREIPAKYPRDALLARTEGWVDLEFTITAAGVPEDLVVRASDPRRTFDHAALDAVKRWRFEPIVQDGVPVAKRARLRMTFKP